MAALALTGLLAAPATAATAVGAEDSLPYCSLNLSTSQLVCAPTEAELLAKRGRSVAADYVLAKMYDSAGNTGSYLEILFSSPCDTNSDVDYSVSNVGSTWNDRISNWTGYSECQVHIYENSSWGGASCGAYTSSSYVGDAMNDRTTSIRFY